MNLPFVSYLGVFSLFVSELLAGEGSAPQVFRIKLAGTVVAWGANFYGESTVPRFSEPIVQIAAGNDANLAVTASGRVVAWGSQSVPYTSVPPGLSNVVAVGAGYGHALALKADGTLAAWGVNSDGQASVPPAASNIVAIAAGFLHSLALRSDGTVLAWGYNGEGEVNIPPGLSNVVAIAAGGHHSLALKSDGSAVQWGRRWELIQLPNPLPAGLSNLVAISAGLRHSLTLDAGGRVVAWGAARDGQVPAPANLSNVVQISAGGVHSMALRADGSVVAWGANGQRQSTVPAGLSNVISISAGAQHSLALILNQPPVAIARISPLLDLSPKVADLLVIAHGGSATVTLDGSASFDPDGHALRYTWQANGSAIPLAVGEIAVASLGLGSHTITLVVDDLADAATDSLAVEVVSIEDVLDTLVVLVNETTLARRSKRLLIGLLKEAQHAVERGHEHSAIRKLEKFQERAASQLGPIDPERAEVLIAATEQIIVLLQSSTDPRPRDDDRDD